jgi:HAMP domain-containing protein
MEQGKSKYSLQRAMIVYFLLIGFASLLVGIEFITDTQSHKLREDLLENFSSYSQGRLDEAALFAPISRLRNKAVLMMAIVLFVVVIVLTMFIKNITEPLQHMIETAREISSGDLSREIMISSDNELKTLGNVINEMSSNLQEIILLSGNLCMSGKAFFNQTGNLIEKETINRDNIIKLKGDMDCLQSKMDILSDVVDLFNCYSVEKHPDH